MILFWIILSLSKYKEKKCYATDEELGGYINSDSRTVRRNLKGLKEKWYILCWTNLSSEGQKCPSKDASSELKKSPRFITFGQKCPPYIYKYIIYNNTSNKNNIYSNKDKENIKNEMLETFRKDERLIRFMNEEDVIKWWNHKQASKKPYKDVGTFITALVKIKNIIKNYWGVPKADRNRRNRFNFAVNEAIEKDWEWLNWYDSMEKVYENSKDDLYPTPKQNE